MRRWERVSSVLCGSSGVFLVTNTERSSSLFCCRLLGLRLSPTLDPSCLVLRSILYAAAFLVWSVLAVLAVASMLNRDRSEAEQLADKKLESLSEQFGRLREGHDDLRLDFRQQLNDLEEVVRSTLFDKLGVVLSAAADLNSSQVLHPASQACPPL